MPKVMIEGTEYTVSPLELEGAAFWRYVFHIGDLAKKVLNAWGDLYKKVKHLPANLQEIAFWRLYHADPAFLCEQDFYQLGGSLGPCHLLVSLMIVGERPEVTVENAARIFAELYPFIEKKPDKEVSGAEAAAVMRRQASEQRVQDSLDKIDCKECGRTPLQAGYNPYNPFVDGMCSHCREAAEERKNEE